MCTSIILEEKDIDIILDSLRAKENELLDDMVFSKEKHDDINRVKDIFSSAKDNLENSKLMAKEEFS